MFRFRQKELLARKWIFPACHWPQRMHWCSGCWLMVIPNIAPKLTSECCCAWIQPQVALSCGRNAKVVHAPIESTCCVMRRVHGTTVINYVENGSIPNPPSIYTCEGRGEFVHMLWMTSILDIYCTCACTMIPLTN